MWETIENFLKNVLGYGFSKFKEVLFGIIFGMALAWVYHKYIGNKSLKDSYERIIEAKEEAASAYRHIIGGELDKVELKAKSNFFDRVKRFFKTADKKP